MLKTKNIKSIENDDKKISFFIISFYYCSILNLVIKTILPIPTSVYPLISGIFMAIILINLLKSIYIVIKRSAKVFILSELIALFVYCVSFLQNGSDINIIINKAFWTIGVCIPLGIYMYSIRNKEVFYSNIVKYSYGMTFILLLIMIFPNENLLYNMSFSYSLLIPIILHINELFNNYKTRNLILAICEIICILLYGSRGALLCIFIFIIIKLILRLKLNVKSFFILIIVSITSINVLYNFKKIGSRILLLLNEKGYYSRTLELLFSGNISQGSGRDNLYIESLSMINEKPLFGFGVGGEFSRLGIYPHNIFLEILLNFGVIIGTACIVILFILTIKAIFYKESISKDLMIIYLCGGFIPLFLSGSYLESYNFFMFIFIVMARTNSFDKFG